MICNFCKEEIKNGKETQILPPDEEKYNCCEECMEGVFSLMESGAMENKSFLKTNSIIKIDQRSMSFHEKLTNGKIKLFTNVLIKNITSLPPQDERYYRSPFADYNNYYGSPVNYGKRNLMINAEVSLDDEDFLFRKY